MSIKRKLEEIVSNHPIISGITTVFLTMALDYERRIQELTTELKQAEEALQTSQEMHRVPLDNVAVGLAIINPDGGIESANPELSHILGYSHGELTGKRLQEITHPDDIDIITDCVHRLVDGKSDVESKMVRYSHTDGSCVVAKVTVSPMKGLDGIVDYLVLSVDDKTQLQKLEAESVQLKKMASMGRGVADLFHTLNNLLGSISCTAELAILKSEYTPDVIETILSEARKCNTFTDKTLRFLRKGDYEPQIIDPCAVAEQAYQSAQTKISSTKCTIDCKSKPNSTNYIHADGSMIEQAFGNLINNGIDAMSVATRDGGTVTITIKDETVTETKQVYSIDGIIPSGSYVKVSISDQGPGIPPKVLERMFEPFFTTKESGKGTGLGLAHVVDTLKRHGAYLNLETSQKGTTFDLYFPSVERTDKVDSPETEYTQPGAGRILFVGSKPPTDVQQYFKLMDIYVHYAANSKEALRIYDQGGINVVLTDSDISPMNNIQLIDKMRKVDEGKMRHGAIVYVRGDEHQNGAAQEILDNRVRYLGNYKLTELARVAGDVFSQSNGHSHKSSVLNSLN